MDDDEGEGETCGLSNHHYDSLESSKKGERKMKQGVGAVVHRQELKRCIVSTRFHFVFQFSNFLSSTCYMFLYHQVPSFIILPFSHCIRDQKT